MNPMPPVMIRPTNNHVNDCEDAIKIHASPWGISRPLNRLHGPNDSISQPAISVVSMDAMPTLDTADKVRRRNKVSN